MLVKDADIYCCKLAKKYGFTMGKGCFGVFAVGPAASVNPTYVYCTYEKGFSE